jgi:hypothetical protein
VQVIASLPPSERAKRYRELATFARRNAQAALSREARMSYLTLASQWERLAELAEQPPDLCK